MSDISQLVPASSFKVYSQFLYIMYDVIMTCFWLKLIKCNVHVQCTPTERKYRALTPVTKLYSSMFAHLLLFNHKRRWTMLSYSVQEQQNGAWIVNTGKRRSRYHLTLLKSALTFCSCCDSRFASPVNTSSIFWQCGPCGLHSHFTILAGNYKHKDGKLPEM